jgi:WD40 repeat protein
VYNTCRPEEAPSQYTAAPSGATEAISKLSWMPDHDSTVIAAKRTGEMQLWDVRTSAATGPVKSVTIPGGGVIMDLELNPAHGTILIASDRRVSCVFISAEPYRGLP